jgi:hypothetical protein
MIPRYLCTYQYDRSIGANHSGRSVNRNRSVRFFGYSVNSVTSEPRTDRFLRELGTEDFRFRVIRFGFGSNRKEPKFSKHKKTAHSNANFDSISSLFYAPNRDNLRSNKHKRSTDTYMFQILMQTSNVPQASNITVKVYRPLPTPQASKFQQHRMHMHSCTAAAHTEYIVIEFEA